MRSELEQEIMEAIQNLNIQDKVRVIKGEEKDHMLSRFHSIYVVGEPRVWWLSLKYKPDIFSFEEDGALSFQRIADFFDSEEEVWFVVEDEFRDDQLLYKAKVRHILAVIGDCSCFEYNIVSENGERFLCETDHDMFLYIDIHKNLLKRRDKARIYVDFNEMVDCNTVLLSARDTKTDSEGNEITFYEGMPVSIYTDDVDMDGNADNLVAEGTAIRMDLSQYPAWQHVKWCCRMDARGIMHESDLRKEALAEQLSTELRVHCKDVLILRGYLVRFQESGMRKDEMREVLEGLRAEWDSTTEDILVELMGFVDGFCRPDLAVFEREQRVF